MKTKAYRNGRFNCKSYLRRAGRGWEVGFIYGGTPLFTGNFVHSTEANQFFTLMKREITKFGKRFKVGPKYSQGWVKKFLGAHLHRTYYKFVTRVVRQHETKFNRDWNKNLRTYKKLNKRWTTKEKKPLLRAA